MNHRWTGGQYSIIRFLLGLLLLFRFASLLRDPLFWLQQGFWSPALLLDGSTLASGGFGLLISLIGMLAALAFAAGRFDRQAAWLLFFLYPWISHSVLVSLSPVHLLLLLHLFLPRAPYLSVAAMGRPDPGNGWTMPPQVFAAVWFFLAALWLGVAVRHGLHGEWLVTLWQDLAAQRPRWLPVPGEGLLTAAGVGINLALVTFALLAFKAAARPFVLAGSFLITALLAPGSPEFLLLHLFALDPGMLKPRSDGAPVLMFYDGYCGLCHRATRFAMAEDAAGALFRFAPLQGATITARLSPEQIRKLPDSVVLLEGDELLVKSGAALAILHRLGGYWRILAIAARLIPRPVRDGVYDLVAALRHRLFPKPADVCPILPPSLRARFLP